MYRARSCVRSVPAMVAGAGHQIAGRHEDLLPWRLAHRIPTQTVRLWLQEAGSYGEETWAHLVIDGIQAHAVSTISCKRAKRNGARGGTTDL